ncbi:spore cortex-lytic enzyme [Faecalibacterium sp. CAG:1138]|nr:spore cortex-lytic enzyme [Faecalibacterium sp. CAG:1138]
MKKFKLAVAVFMTALTIITAGICASNLTAEAAETVVLKSGSTGAQVRTLQTKLKNWGYYRGAIDGIYGSGTKAAVIKFQKKNGLTADGIVGAKTAAALGMKLSASSSTNSGYASSDVYLLAKLVYGEARGEPYTGQVAVAAVVLNRVKSNKFPNTIAGVIYQSGAFTAVSDGQINLEPNSTAYSAARDAMNGWDPTSGCLYYYNPATATSKWIWSRQVRLSIGRHNFCV